MTMLKIVTQGINYTCFFIIIRHINYYYKFNMLIYLFLFGPLGGSSAAKLPGSFYTLVNTAMGGIWPSNFRAALLS
jgi:hypothetical protein